MGAELRRVDIDDVRGRARRPRVGEHQSRVPQQLNLSSRCASSAVVRSYSRRGSRPATTSPCFESLIPELPAAAPARLTCAAFPELRLLVQLGSEPLGGVLSFDELMRAGQDLDEAPLASTVERLDADQVFNIQFTSGTTGTPKGAALTHFNVVNNGFFTGEGMRLTADDRICIPVPLYHCFGMVLGVLAAMTHRAASVLPGEGFEPLAVLQTVASERCTVLHGVPTMFIAELEHPRFGEFDLSSLRTGIMAGSPCPIAVMRRVVAEMHMPELTIGYGMTETSPVSFQTEPDDSLELRVGTVGRVHPHVQVKIVDADGRVVPRGVAGELLDSRLQRDARLLGGARAHAGRDRRGRLDAHRRFGGHRRAGLLQHRRAGEGHDHPRRREYFSARDRGVPLSTSGGVRRGGGRGA